MQRDCKQKIITNIEKVKLLSKPCNSIKTDQIYESRIRATEKKAGELEAATLCTYFKIDVQIDSIIRLRISFQGSTYNFLFDIYKERKKI